MRNPNENTTQLYPNLTETSASPRVNTTLDLVLWDENRGHFACDAKNNKNIPMWTWLWGREHCAFPAAKSQRGAARASDPCQGLPQSSAFSGVLGFCL